MTEHICLVAKLICHVICWVIKWLTLVCQIYSLHKDFLLKKTLLAFPFIVSLHLNEQPIHSKSSRKCANNKWIFTISKLVICVKQTNRLSLSCLLLLCQMCFNWLPILKFMQIKAIFILLALQEGSFWSWSQSKRQFKNGLLAGP